MVTIEHNEGRLIEIRQTSLVTMEEITANAPKMGGMMTKIGRPIYVIADWRGIRVLSPKVSELLLNIMQANNVDRTAVIIDDNAIIGLQLERIFRAVGSENQLACRTAKEIETWYAATMTKNERDALHRFLVAGSKALAAAPRE